MTDIPDVDIDVADHFAAADLFPLAVPASQISSKGRLVRHNSAIYLQRIPMNPLNGLASFPYEKAEEFGYYKFDLLSNNIYKQFASMDELRLMLQQPIDWDWFKELRFVSALFHFGGIVNQELTMAQVVVQYEPQSIIDLACLIAIKLPAKKYLIGESWEFVREHIWLPEPIEKGKPFKKSHANAYAMVVGLDARLKAPGYFNPSESKSRSFSDECDEDIVLQD